MKVYVVQARKVMGVLFWTGSGNRWSDERPDAQEFRTWREASNAVGLLFEAYPTSPAAQVAEVAEEETADA
jgi:hypothetical protein